MLCSINQSNVKLQPISMKYYQRNAINFLLALSDHLNWDQNLMKNEDFDCIISQCLQSDDYKSQIILNSNLFLEEVVFHLEFSPKCVYASWWILRISIQVMNLDYWAHRFIWLILPLIPQVASSHRVNFYWICLVLVGALSSPINPILIIQIILFLQWYLLSKSPKYFTAVFPQPKEYLQHQFIHSWILILVTVLRLKSFYLWDFHLNKLNQYSVEKVCQFCLIVLYSFQITPLTAIRILAFLLL